MDKHVVAWDTREKQTILINYIVTPFSATVLYIYLIIIVGS